MIRYNWPKIYTMTEGDPINCMRIIEMLTFNKIPDDKYDPIYYFSMHNFRGQSFLLHPELLLYNGFRYSRRDLSIYVAIASARSYSDYLSTGLIDLPLDLCTIHPHEYLTDKTLLPIENDIIVFPYEKTPEKHLLH